MEESWQKLPATEKNNYLEFHERAYKEDLKHSEKNILEFPRWSIISGYYCMHNITKLFLAKEFNIKITSPNIHKKTIDALEKLIQEKAVKERLLKLLKEAKELCYSIERLKERVVPTLLKKGKEERGKAQYYTEDYKEKIEINSQKGAYFIDQIVKPYTKIIEGLIKCS